MANHLTPQELSTLLGMSHKDVVRLCRQEAVPIYNGRVDKMLFLHSLQEIDYPLPETAAPLLRAV